MVEDVRQGDADGGADDEDHFGKKKEEGIRLGDKTCTQHAKRCDLC